MTSVLQDVRLALRSLRRNPAFTVVAILTLAVAIGSNTAIFTVVHSVLLRPLPFEEPDRLLRVQSLDRESGEPGNLSPADFLDFQREASSLVRMGANGWIGPATVVGADGRGERVGQVQVTEGFFPTLGVRPALGRGFSPEEALAGGDRVAVLSDRLWRIRFGADPGIVGRTVALDAVPTTVIGVLPPSYRHIEERTDRTADVFTPLRIDRADPNRGGHFIRGVARLGPERSLEAARAELDAIAARLEARFPDSNRDLGVHVEPLQEAVAGDARAGLLLLLGATGLILLVGCTNLANLLLARGAGRRRELALRSALGASRWRLVRQRLTESLVLGAIGGTLGLLLAFVATEALAGLSAAVIPRAEDVRIGSVVLMFAALVTVGTSVAFGLLPALVQASGDLRGRLSEGGRQGAPAVPARIRGALIVAEVAASVVLLVGAGLLVESLWRLQNESPGFGGETAVTLEVAPPRAGYPDGAQIGFQQALEERVAALPGVAAVGAVNILPLTDNYDGRGIQIEDAPEPRENMPSAQARSVTPGYFQVMGIPLLSGRLFDQRDDGDGPLVVLVSESMASRFWPGRDPVGRRITFNGGIPDAEARPVGGPGSREVVGVVGDVKHLELGSAPVPTFYTPHAQPPSSHAMSLVVRASGDATALVPSIRGELAELDPTVPVARVRTLDQVVGSSMARSRLRAGLLALFAAVGVLLAAVGVYGVVGHLVRRRTAEIGIRLAMGASDRAVIRMFLREGIRPIGLGLALGLLGAFLFARLIRAMLFEMTPLAPAPYLAACAVVTSVGVVAILLPARRAVAGGSAAALRDS